MKGPSQMRATLYSCKYILQTSWEQT